MTFYEACSAIDLGGLLIIIVGLASLLVPLSLAALQPNGYKTPWVISLMILGGLMILALPAYEKFIVTHPLCPPEWLTHRSIGLAFLLYLTDNIASNCSHSFIFNWAIISRGYSVVLATNLSYIHSVAIFFTGMWFGLVMWKTRTYKWWIMGGAVIRLLFYALMFRIRTSNPSVAELFVVQCMQGIGAGIVESGAYVAAVVHVPHRQTAQMAALVVMIGMIGRAVGGAIAGAIYTGTMREQLAKELGENATPELINALFNSINKLVPEWGTVERIAINAAVSYSHPEMIFC